MEFIVSFWRKFLLEMCKMVQKIKGLYLDSNIELIVECNIPTNRCAIYVFVFCTKRKEIWYQFEHMLPIQFNKNDTVNISKTTITHQEVAIYVSIILISM